MASCNGGLERVGTAGATERLRACQGRETSPNEDMVPASSVLLEQQDRLSRRTDPRPQPRCLNLHQRHQAVNLRLLRGELGQDPTETECILAERGADPVVPGGS